MVQISIYQARDELLLRLGFKSYEKYLNSALWKSIRERGYEAHGRLCKICGDDAAVLHHKNYQWELMSGKTVKGLVPLCHDCHYSIEFCDTGKRRLDQANNFLAYLLGTGKIPTPPKITSGPAKKISACPSMQSATQRGYSIPRQQARRKKRLLQCSRCDYAYNSKFYVRFAVCPKCNVLGESQVQKLKQNRQHNKRKDKGGKNIPRVLSRKRVIDGQGTSQAQYWNKQELTKTPSDGRSSEQIMQELLIKPRF